VPANVYAKHKEWDLTEHMPKIHPCAPEYEIFGSTVAKRYVDSAVKHELGSCCTASAHKLRCRDWTNTCCLDLHMLLPHCWHHIRVLHIVLSA
jgi:hypothetical protein